VEVDSNPLMSLATMILGTTLPPPGDRGFLVGQLLHHVLSGKQGRLARDRTLVHTLALNLPLRLLAERTPVSVLPVAWSEHPQLAVYAECDPAAVENAHQALLQHLESLAQGAIRPEELDRAKHHLINSRALSMLAPGTLAAQVGAVAMFGGDPNGLAHSALEIEQLTKEDIIRTAQAHFQYHYVGVQMPDRHAIPHSEEAEQ
jgi:hypothetical protein